VLAGLALLVRPFMRVVSEGLGTPAPVAPTERLVVGGEYRYVRNPMYVGVESIILGQVVLFGSVALLQPLRRSVRAVPRVWSRLVAAAASLAP
jgi:protein-S-isoprenylcysteine O-methyltransferase Ste14